MSSKVLWQRHHAGGSARLCCGGLLATLLFWSAAALAQSAAEERDAPVRHDRQPASAAPQLSEEHAPPPEGKTLRIETGAPRPPVQTVGVPRAVPPPGAPPSPPTVKVGGGLILVYFHPFGMSSELRARGQPDRKPILEVFRASILLDSKIDRFGIHLDFRARDKRMRTFNEGTAWLEEAYVSVDLLRPASAWGPLTLKVGKTYAQLGRFFDYQFIGSLALRDGLKFDANYGVSLEGTLGKGKLGTRYYGQYFVIDGGTNTSIETRDTISNPAPLSGYPSGLARKRNMLVGRIEPFLQLHERVSFRLGGSLQNFTADFGPTLDQQNVLRYGADVTADVAWFGAWAEYAVQRGRSTLLSPFAPSPAVDGATDPYMRPSSAATPARSSDRVHYLIAGGRVFYKNVMLRYHFSSATFYDVSYPIADVPGTTMPKVAVRETMHTAGVSIFVTPQLSLWLEVPIWRRHMDGAQLALPAAAGGPRSLPARDWLLDQQVVVTLHGTI